uniref:Uncharacterized protein n=1 Tax=Panagrolaimus sp. JU765 TaxID=591449 RepID=A0AC34PZV2_9BILA
MTNPIDSLWIKHDRTKTINEYQLFLKMANFLDGAYFKFRVQTANDKTIWVYITHIKDWFFIHSPKKIQIHVNQVIKENGVRILYLNTSNPNGIPFDKKPIPFTVVAASNPNKIIFSGVLTKSGQGFLIKNVKFQDWIKVNLQPSNSDLYVAYSKEMKSSFIPKNGKLKNAHDFKTIINLLGTPGQDHQIYLLAKKNLTFPK